MPPAGFSSRAAVARLAQQQRAQKASTHLAPRLERGAGTAGSSLQHVKGLLLSFAHPCRHPQVRIRPFSSISPCPEELWPEESRRGALTQGSAVSSPCCCVIWGPYPTAPALYTPLSTLCSSLALHQPLLAQLLLHPAPRPPSELSWHRCPCAAPSPAASQHRSCKPSNPAH